MKDWPDRLQGFHWQTEPLDGGGSKERGTTPSLPDGAGAQFVPLTLLPDVTNLALASDGWSATENPAGLPRTTKGIGETLSRLSFGTPEAEDGADPNLAALPEQDERTSISPLVLLQGDRELAPGSVSADEAPLALTASGTHTLSAANSAITVTTLDDESFDGGSLAAEAADGSGLSLREAIGLADAQAGEDQIGFAGGLAGGTMLLTLGQLVLSSDVTIDGDSDDDHRPDITVDARNLSRVLEIVAGTATIDGLTITNGIASGAGRCRCGSCSRTPASRSRSSPSRRACASCGPASPSSGRPGPSAPVSAALPSSHWECRRP